MELLLIAAVIVFYLAIYYSEIFTHRNASMLAGLALGAGLLSKTVFVFWAAPPFLLVLGETIVALVRKAGNRSDDAARTLKTSTSRLVNALIAGAIGLIPAALFYLPMADKLFKEVFVDFHHWSRRPLAQDLGYYFSSYFNNNHGLVLVLCVAAFLVMIPAALRDRRVGLLYLWVIVPHAAFTAFGLKFASYTMAYYPALCLLAALMIKRIPVPRIVAALGWMLILFSLGRFGAAMFQFTSFPHFDPAPGTVASRVKAAFQGHNPLSFICPSNEFANADLVAGLKFIRYPETPADQIMFYSAVPDMEPDQVLYNMVLRDPDFAWQQVAISYPNYAGFSQIAERLPGGRVLIVYTDGNAKDPWPRLDRERASIFYDNATIDRMQGSLDKYRDRYRTDLSFRAPNGDRIFCLVF